MLADEVPSSNADQALTLNPRRASTARAAEPEPELEPQNKSEKRIDDDAQSDAGTECSAGHADFEGRFKGSQYPFPLQWTDGSDTPMDPSVESFQMDNGGATTYKTLENMVKTWRALLLISSPC